MNTAEYNQHFQSRTKQLPIAVIKLAEHTKRGISADIILRQLVRSATSVAANYQASCVARSDKERYAKLSIVVEEADETLFWLDLATEANILQNESVESIHKEAQEFVRVFMTYRAKLKAHP